jgi:hypothetical protein
MLGDCHQYLGTEVHSPDPRFHRDICTRVARADAHRGKDEPVPRVVRSHVFHRLPPAPNVKICWQKQIHGVDEPNSAKGEQCDNASWPRHDHHWLQRRPPWLLGCQWTAGQDAHEVALGGAMVPRDRPGEDDYWLPHG